MVVRAQRRRGCRRVGEHEVDLVLAEEREQRLRRRLAADHLDLGRGGERGTQHAIRDELRHDVGDADRARARGLPVGRSRSVSRSSRPSAKISSAYRSATLPASVSTSDRARFLEQLLAQRLLEQAQLRADRRLREMELPRRRGDAPLVRHHPEVEEVVVVQPLHHCID